MEIADYLQVAKKSLWILIVVPLAAMAIAASVVILTPPNYAATATVDVPIGGGSGQFSGTQGVTQYVNAFKATAVSGVVLAQVSQWTKVPVKQLAAGLQVNQVGQSSQMTIQYADPQRNIPALVVQTDATDTLKNLFGGQVTGAQDTLDRAKAALAALQQKANKIIEKAGGLPPDKLFASVKNQIAQLTQQKINCIASGSATCSAAVQAEIDSLNGQLATLQPLVIQYQSILTDLGNANALVRKQQVTLADAQQQLDSADPAKVVTVSATKKQSRLPSLFVKTAAAAAAGIFLAVGIVVVLELLRRRRPAGEGEAQGDDDTEEGSAARGLRIALSPTESGPDGSGETLESPPRNGTPFVDRSRPPAGRPKAGPSGTKTPS